MLKVLSIDGGGIRGIIAAVVLAEIEYRTQKPICQLFDLIAGTSTGGILTVGLTKPHPLHPDRPQFKAEEFIEMYFNYGKQIFKPNLWKTAGMNIFARGKYPARGIEQLLQSYLGETWLSEALTEVLVTAYEIERRDTWIFKRRRALEQKRFDFKMSDIARASSAAPSYFRPARILPREGKDKYYLIDGGLFANNPSMVAYVECIKNYPPAESAHCLMVSLGTGEIVRPYYYKKAKNWGLINWAKPTMDILLNGSSMAIDHQLAIVFSVRENHHYFRLQCRVDKAYSDFDQPKLEFLKYYLALAKRMVTERNKEIDKICHLLS